MPKIIDMTDEEFKELEAKIEAGEVSQEQIKSYADELARYLAPILLTKVNEKIRSFYNFFFVLLLISPLIFIFYVTR